ncbi:MAG: prepilin-type N-terminal cleavage/methylation domain-containing protein [Proteobacteria bacterium]|nr:prepilin-type N-terminal cleavage/methylation domain-containing protein [Pseudomonadota bacterium]
MNLRPQRPRAYRLSLSGSEVDSTRHDPGGWQRAFSPKDLIQKHGTIRGFTLLELTLVILILGILLALSLPSLGNLAGGDLNVSSRRLSGTVKYLFHRATLKRTIYRLNYDLKANEYWVTYRDETLEFVKDTSPLTRKVKLPQGISFEDIVIIGKGKFTEGEVETHFFPKGWVEETLVHLKDSKGRQSSIHILPLSARVRIYDRYIEPSS